MKLQTERRFDPAATVHTKAVSDLLQRRRSTFFRRSRRWSRYSSGTFYLFIAPWVIGFLGLTVIPLVYAFLLSFTNWDGISPHWSWIGWQNYAALLHDSVAWHSLLQTFLFMGIQLPLSIIGGLGLALLLNVPRRGVGIYRVLVYLPSLVPIAAGAIIWRLMFDRDAGAINAVFEALGGKAITWLVDPSIFFALIIMTLWGIGGGMIIFLAALQGIPTELLESARIDGAKGLRSFLHITLPLLTPVLLFQLVLGVIASLQTLVQPLLLTQGAYGAYTPDSVHFFMVDVYEQFFTYGRFGYGSALLWVLFFAVLALTLLVLRTSAFWVYYEVDQERGDTQ
jgi:multiple sugar transport system permease protein